MKYSDILKQMRMALVEKNKAVLDKAKNEKRALLPVEFTAWETTAAEIDNYDKQITAAERQEAMELAAAAHPGPGAARPAITAPANPGVTGIYRPFAEIRRHERPKNFKAATIPQAQEDAYRSGMWCRAVIYNDQKAREWCNEHGVPIVRDVAQGENANSLGGVLVPVEFETAIIDLRESFGVFRSFAMPKTMASDSSTRPRRSGGLTAFPVGENAAITESNKTWDQVNLTARKWGVLTRYSNELAADAVISIADDLSSEIAYAFASAEDDAGWNGDGSSNYHGITGLRTKYAVAAVGGQLKGAVDAASNHDTYAEIDGDDLDLVVAALPEYARQNAKWYTSSVGKALVFDPLLRAAGGNSKVDVAGRMLDQYLGYPIAISQKLPIVTTDLSDVAMLFFGDLAMAVTFGTRMGIAIATDASRYFEFDQLGIRGIERFDINAHDVGTTATAGPIVALVGE